MKTGSVADSSSLGKSCLQNHHSVFLSYSLQPQFNIVTAVFFYLFLFRCCIFLVLKIEINGVIIISLSLTIKTLIILNKYKITKAIK